MKIRLFNIHCKEGFSQRDRICGEVIPNPGIKIGEPVIIKKENTEELLQTNPVTKLDVYSQHSGLIHTANSMYGYVTLANEKNKAPK